MDQIELAVDHREALGKSVKALRRQGITPVHLFGRGVDSLALQCETPGLIRVLAEAGQTRLVGLKIAGERKPRSVLVRGVQVSPVKSGLLHVDFFQVSLAERVRVDVPIVLTSEAPVTRQKEYILVQEMDTVSVECLPADMPGEVTLDLAVLTEPDHVLRVSDIDLGDDVTVVSDPEQAVVRISLLRLAEEEVVEGAEVEVEEAEAPAAEPAAAPAEGDSRAA